jgi:hypothetical protein
MNRTPFTEPLLAARLEPPEEQLIQREPQR